MARVLRVQQVHADGSSAADKPFPYYPDVDVHGKPYCDETGRAWIEISLRPVTKEQYAYFIKARTTHAPDASGAIVERIDWKAVNADVVEYAVVSWRGIVGADDKALVCIAATKRVLDEVIQQQIRNRAIFAQPAEVAAASFREPPPVPGVVGGLREDDALLRARDAAGAAGRT